MPLSTQRGICCPYRRYIMFTGCYIPFTRSSKHQADIEQTSSWLVRLTYSQLVEPAWSCKRGISLSVCLWVRFECLHRTRWWLSGGKQRILLEVILLLHIARSQLSVLTILRLRLNFVFRVFCIVFLVIRVNSFSLLCVYVCILPGEAVPEMTYTLVRQDVKPYSLTYTGLS